MQAIKAGDKAEEEAIFDAQLTPDYNIALLTLAPQIIPTWFSATDWRHSI